MQSGVNKKKRMGDGESKDQFKFGQLSTLLEEADLDFRTEDAHRTCFSTHDVYY